MSKTTLGVAGSSSPHRSASGRIINGYVGGPASSVWLSKFPGVRGILAKRFNQLDWFDSQGVRQFRDVQQTCIPFPPASRPTGSSEP